MSAHRRDFLTTLFSRPLTRVECTVGVIALLSSAVIAAPVSAQGPQDEDQSALMADRANETTPLTPSGTTSASRRRQPGRPTGPDRRRGECRPHDPCARVHRRLPHARRRLQTACRSQGRHQRHPRATNIQTLKVVYETAPRSWADLMELQAAIVDLDGVTATAPTVQNGTLEVQASSAVGPGLIAQYGDAVQLVDNLAGDIISCNTRTSCDSPRAAIQIYPADDSGFICTLGFIVKANSSGNLKAVAPVTAAPSRVGEHQWWLLHRPNRPELRFSR